MSATVSSNTIAETGRAIEELLDELGAASAALTLIFYGVAHDDQVIARALDQRTGRRGVAGTTAGEIGRDGFASNSMTGLSLHGKGARAAVEVVPELRKLSLVPIVHLPDKLARRIGRQRDELDPARHLWLFLMDGASGKEGLLTPFFMQAAPRVGLVGASLGGEDPSRSSRLVHHGRVYRDAAAAMLVEYDGPFSTFKHTHMQLSDRHLEVTRVSDGGRLLEQLDGQPAQQAYAKALGVKPSKLSTRQIVSHPLGYRFRGRAFPVSILEVEADHSFRLGHSVHYGQTLSILDSCDLVGSTRDFLQKTTRELASCGGDPQAMLLFHCVARFVEASEQGDASRLGEALGQAPMCGFNTFGEQFQTLHMNHSLTGVIFG